MFVLQLTSFFVDKQRYCEKVAMDADRITKLKEFQKNSPDDPFYIYALALEYKYENPGESLKYFRELLAGHSHYLPAYYHAAEVLAGTGDREQADQVYQLGIALAKEQGDSHTLRELQNAYTNFQFDD